MDFENILQELYQERKLLSEAIRVVEEMIAKAEPGRNARKRRGRKSMPIEERQEVSRRMKRYWAARRKK